MVGWQPKRDLDLSSILSQVMPPGGRGGGSMVGWQPKRDLDLSSILSQVMPPGGRGGGSMVGWQPKRDLDLSSILSQVMPPGGGEYGALLVAFRIPISYYCRSGFFVVCKCLSAPYGDENKK